MSALRIFLIGPAFPLRGGLAVFDESLCREFNKAGHHCEIISYSLQYPGFLFPGSTQYDTTGNAPEGITIHTKINSVNPFSWRSVGRFIKEQEPDFVVIRFWLPFMGPALGTISRIAKKNGKTKIIAITDNVIPHEKRPGDSAFTKYFLKACDGFITMSKKVMLDLEQFTKTEHKVFTVHPFYDAFGEKVDKQIAREKLGIPADEKTILFFGFIRRYKGLDLLLEALADPRLKERQVKLLVAGEFYEKREYYDEIVQRLGLADRVRMTGDYIENADVKYYFSAADLLTLTYHSATQSGVTQTAFQFDKPVLVTDVGGLAEIIPHGKAGYVVPIDAKAVADSVVDFYDNNREAAFTQGMIAEKPRFAWNIFVDKIVNLHDRISAADDRSK
ncbi:MAG: group 1 glycosyl transferase [Bacteroidetes bacterium]|nr:MAG: group 1 glycosyl transferase [Bacteroidota bacterium]